MAIGYIAMTDGPGYLTIAGDGRRFIMETGFMMITMAGYGYPEISGPLPGLPGGNQATITDGRLFLPAQIGMADGGRETGIGILFMHNG